MTRVMAVSFTPNGRLYYVDPGPVAPVVGASVLVPTDSGPEVATVVWADAETEIEADLPVCAGLAEAPDLARDAENRRARAETEEVAKALVRELDLPMRVVGVDVDDRSAEYGRFVAVYYTAPQRVDFRALLRELAAALKARVDLRQVGARDAARIIGGVGTCGRELCCTTFLPAIAPISMKMARDQDLAGGQLQLQGQCGRLKCCLAYEEPMYADFARRAPAQGCRVTTPDGTGVVVGRSVPCDTVTVRGPDGQRRTCPVSQVRAARGPRPGKAQPGQGATEDAPLAATDSPAD